MKSYLLVDIDHNITKTVLIQNQKIAGIAYSPTTIDEPVFDVTKGVEEAIRVLEVELNKSILNGGRPRPDFKLKCSSSSGGGLHMVVTSLTKGISGESAQRAALGAGALLIDLFCKDDGRPIYKKINILRSMKPDILLMSGGTDGGATRQILEMAEIINDSDIKPRFGKEYDLPVIFAGNVFIQEEIEKIIGKNGFALKKVENVRPSIDIENLGPARDSIYDVYMEHVIIHSPGFPKLKEWTSERIVPSQAATGKIFYEFAKERGVNIIAVDLGGDTTDFYSVYNGVFNRSLNAGIGLTYGICNVVREAGIENIQRWLPVIMDERRVRNIIGNMMINPPKILSKEEVLIQSAISREIIRLGLEEHKGIASRLKGVVVERTIVEKLGLVLESTIINMMNTDVIVGKGNLFRIQSLEESSLILIDSLQPEGITEIYIDSENMATSLGNLIEHEKVTALNLFKDKGLRFIGTCIAPRGKIKLGQNALKIEIKASDGKTSYQFNSGDLTVIPIRSSGMIEVTMFPNKLDLGLGSGKKVKKEINCARSQLGIIVDTRGRPIDPIRRTMKLHPVQ